MGKGGAPTVDRLKTAGIAAQATSGVQVNLYDLEFVNAGDEHIGALAHPRRGLFDPATDKADADLLASMRTGFLRDKALGVWEYGTRLIVIYGCRRWHAADRLHRERATTGDDAKATMVPIVLLKPSRPGDLKRTIAEMLRYRLAENNDPTRRADAPSVIAKTVRALRLCDVPCEEIAALPELRQWHPAIDAAIVDALDRWSCLTVGAAARFDAFELPVDLLPEVLLAEPHNMDAVVELLIGAGASTRKTARKLLRPARAASMVKRPSAKALLRVRAVLTEDARLSHDTGTVALLADFCRLVMGEADALDEWEEVPDVRHLVAAIKGALAPQKPGRKPKDRKPARSRKETP